MTLSKDTIRDTDSFLSSIVKTKSFVPSDLDLLYYVLASEFGLTLEKIENLPIPYLISLIDTFSYIKKEEEKANKKARRRK